MTPTVIRHATCGDRVFMVISYTEQSIHPRYPERTPLFLYVFQSYRVGDGGQTELMYSAPYSSEATALSVWDREVTEYHYRTAPLERHYRG